MSLYQTKKMVGVYVQSLRTGKWLQIEGNPADSSRTLSFATIRDQLFDWDGIPRTAAVDVKFFHGGRQVLKNCVLIKIGYYENLNSNSIGFFRFFPCLSCSVYFIFKWASNLVLHAAF